jgi:CubicO group peptidase (beta-lactamase class C family)
MRHRVGNRRWGCIVRRGGATVAEWYGGGFGPSDLFEIGSLRKSFASALIGTGLEAQTVTLDTPAARAWPGIVAISGAPKDEAITLHHLASGVSGWLTDDPPGARFRYSNAAFTAAERVIARMMSLPDDEIAPEAHRLFGRAAESGSWRFYHFDRAFDPADIGNPGPKLAVESTLADLVSWGEAWLRGGVARDGSRLFPAAWAHRATRPVHPGLADAHYGYCWFVNSGRALWPLAPDESFGHVGFGTFVADGRPSRAYLWACPALAACACVVSEPRSGFGNDFLKVPLRVTAEWVERVAAVCA